MAEWPVVFYLYNWYSTTYREKPGWLAQQRTQHNIPTIDACPAPISCGALPLQPYVSRQCTVASTEPGGNSCQLMCWHGWVYLGSWLSWKVPWCVWRMHLWTSWRGGKQMRCPFTTAEGHGSFGRIWGFICLGHSITLTGGSWVPTGDPVVFI